MSAKSILLAPLRGWLRATAKLRRGVKNLYYHAALAQHLHKPVPASVVVLGAATVEGTGAVTIGERCFFYSGLHFETQGSGSITIGEGVVLSRGVHLVAMNAITIGRGTMIGEYTSVRDANHQRSAETALRDAGHTADAITIGDEVWIGRGVTILPGVTIGDSATVGANAVVTRDVAAHTVVAGVPAKPIASR